MFSKPMSKAMGPARHTGRAASSVLNLDILCHILLFVETHKDLLATMMTCHALYNAGIQPLVQLPIKIYAHTIHLFHDFMLAHSHLTFLVFRELRVEYDLQIPSCEDTYLILELLERGTKLKQLELPSAIFDTKEIGEAVVCLTELQELALEGPCYYSISRILTRLHSPLTNIDIVLEDDGEDEDEDVTNTKNPVLLLAHFQTTLERASITSSQLFSEDVYYPKLLDLDLQLSGGPSLSVLATAFPNLKTLSIGIKTEMEHAELTILRHQNVIFQDGRKCWESLISVHADSVALYAMGLKHTLKSVTIWPLRKLTPVHLSFLRAVISTTKTKALSLHLEETPGILSEVLCDVGNPLMFLELRLQIRWGVDHEKTLDDLFKGLSSVTAVMFQFTPYNFPYIMEKSKADALQDFLHNLDERRLAHQIGAYMRNVACIGLNIERRRGSYWMNMGSGTEEEWTMVQPEDVATRGGLGGLLGQAISIMSSNQLE